MSFRDIKRSEEEEASTSGQDGLESMFSLSQITNYK
jgi:hypothetical protein